MWKNWISREIKDERITIKKDITRSKGLNKYYKPTGKYVNDKGFIKEVEKELYRINTKYVGIYDKMKKGSKSSQKTLIWQETVKSQSTWLEEMRMARL